jgi:hypothetical protein
MTTLLVLTVGQTDVQLVKVKGRTEIDKRSCARLHQQLEVRTSDWNIVDTPPVKLTGPATDFPSGAFSVCTPKLDAVLDDLDTKGVHVTHALILETRRDPEAERGDPRAAGLVLARRLRERLGEDLDAQRTSILQGSERLEDRASPRDAVVQREVVARIDHAVRGAMTKIADGRIVVATAGGMPAIATLVDEIVRLHAHGNAAVELIEVADGAKDVPPGKDRVVARSIEPTESYRARRHALELLEGGNLLGAWGAVRHLHRDEVESRWARILEWLAHFAASLPIPDACDIPVLRHAKMAVRAALRLELALRADDIPRAVHGTVAFFESALWDRLGERLERSTDPSKRRLFRLKSGDAPTCDKLLRKGDSSDDDRKRPFEHRDKVDGVDWYWIHDDEACAGRLAKYYLRSKPLEDLNTAVSKVRELRNDVAHNEPTPELMGDARRRMADANLWSSDGRFLPQQLVRDVLIELGEPHPDRLCDDLIRTARSRLLEHSLDP